MALGEDGNVSLECKVIGIPQPTLTWFKDGKELRAGDLHQLTQVHQVQYMLSSQIKY